MKDYRGINNENISKFIAVDNKNEIMDNADYTFEIYKSLNSSGLIKSISISPEDVSFGVAPIRSLDDEYNLFLLQFNSKENERSHIWSIYFQYGTYNKLISPPLSSPFLAIVFLS